MNEKCDYTCIWFDRPMLFKIWREIMTCVLEPETAVNTYAWKIRIKFQMVCKLIE
jgi:hypothetical protein